MLDMIVELLVENMIEGETIFSVSWCIIMFGWLGIFFSAEVWEGCIVHYLQVSKELEFDKIF